MASSRTRQQILDIIATDNTFKKVLWRGQTVWQGKCIHCRRKLVVSQTGERLSSVTIEHIVARNHGGDNSPQNLALACSRCNNLKGVRHDKGRTPSARVQEINAKLLEERQRRWRDPESS